MPGSLFIRSPSVQPDLNQRRVHFTPRHSRRPASTSPAQLRPRMIPSVRAAVQRFCPDDDPSLLLPIISPSKKSSTHPRPSTSSVDRQSSDSSLDLRRHDYYPDGSSTSRRLDKGKQRAQDHTTDGPVTPEGRPASEIAVQGKERELLAAREQHDRNEQRWERDNHAAQFELERMRDKERIRALEREIELLKQELAQRPRSSSRGYSGLPHHPPPPPAPPPPNVISSSSSNAGSANILFESARAALRHAGPPVEAPVNPQARTRRQGQPTVKVPSEKMAAFLNEIKTAKLRKVGSVQRLSRSNSDSSGGLHRRASTGATVRAARTADSGVKVGEKRKRSEHGDIVAPAAKRRSPPPAASASSTSSSQRNPPNPMLLSRSYPSSSANRTWPSISITTETDLTTPSLCSDNDIDRLDETLPITPPDLQSVTKRPTKHRPPREIINVDMEDDVVEVVPAPPPPRLSVPSSRASTSGLQKSPSAQRMSDILAAKRPPTSPMPSRSPRKPRPPARISIPSATTGNRGDTMRRDVPDRENEDELPAAAPARNVNNMTGTSRTARSQASSSTPGERELSSSSSRLPRRRPRRSTLEEEFRAAGELEWSEDEQGETDADLDSGVLVGVGTRDKRAGFLARGGAGGVPVFMGVGYVEGAVEVPDDEEEDHQPRRRISRRSRWQSEDS